jgi:uncharacterized protein YdeI (YjbR/CyaY-like superfamily)
VEPTFFSTPEEFRSWLEQHHAMERELLVGLHKTSSGRPSITWPESVDQALCFGWIDGVRRRIDDESYTIRFTPRKERSTWSAVNITRARELIDLGLMRPAGVAAFERRANDRTAIFSHEQRKAAKLEAKQQRRLEANADAWAWFQAQAPSYRRAAIHWVTSAKRPETRERRLQLLIDDSAAARPVPPLRAARRATRA